MPPSLDKFSRLAALKPVRQTEQMTEPLSEPAQEDEIARLIGAVPRKTRFGQHLTVRNWYSTPEFAEPAGQALDLLTRNKDEALSRRTRAALEDPNKWLFLDAETTGLAGGTGTYAFLVGIGWWDAGGLQVEQFFMRDFADEHSVLSELAERIAERPALVTFNGKTFDWPLLLSRFTMTRKIAAPRLAAHLDLLHPARALWRLRLGSVRLIELERQVLDAERLGWHRADDVPSSFIPQFYFNYLRGGSARPLAGVVRHNQMDLRGLAALFGKINTMLADDEPAQTDGRDLFGLSRFLHRRGDAPRAAKMCTKALEAGLPAEHRHQASRELALMARRRGDYLLAAELWRSLLEGSQNVIEASEQLAIHYERRERNLRQAIEYAQLGLSKLRSGGMRLIDPYAEARIARQEKNLLRRLTRLQQRLASEPAPSQKKRTVAAVAGQLL